MTQVHALDGEITRLQDSEFYQSVKQAFAIVATTDSLLFNNIVITKGARGV
jgi:L-fucose mutarotase/ribose pyranase (RbsD/FucU family)